MFDDTVMITPSSIPTKFSAGRIVVTLCTLYYDFLISNMSDKQRFQRVVNHADRLTGCATDAINLFIGPSQSNCRVQLVLLDGNSLYKEHSNLHSY